jgi:hypothetical protein
VSRARFESLCSSVVSQCTQLIQQALDKAGCSTDSIAKVGTPQYSYNTGDIFFCFKTLWRVAWIVHSPSKKITESEVRRVSLREKCILFFFFVDLFLQFIFHFDSPDLNFSHVGVEANAIAIALILCLRYTFSGRKYIFSPNQRN